MPKLDFEKAEEPEIKLPTSIGSSKKWEFQINIYFCFTDYAKAFDCVDHNKLELRLPGEISVTSDMQMTHPYGRKWRRTQEPVDESERVKKLA